MLTIITGVVENRVRLKRVPEKSLLGHNGDVQFPVFWEATCYSAFLDDAHEEENKEIKWSRNSQATELLKSSNLRHKETILFLL